MQKSFGNMEKYLDGLNRLSGRAYRKGVGQRLSRKRQSDPFVRSAQQNEQHAVILRRWMGSQIYALVDEIAK